MEGAAVTEEKIEERVVQGSEQAEALRRTVADLQGACAELEKVAAADRSQAEAIAGDLRKQIEQVRAELASAGAEKRELDAASAAKRERELAKGEEGLMGEVARKHEAKLHLAKTRHAQAQARLSVHTATLSREVRELEVADAAATAALAAGDTEGPGDARGGMPGGKGGEAAAEAALASSLARIEATFTHRRPPPAQRPPALVARWRRLQTGEPFVLRTAVGAEQRVWVSLSEDVRTVHMSETKGAPPLISLALAEVLHMDSDARTLCLHTVRGTRVALVAADAPMLGFWYVGLQQITSVPCVAYMSRGALLWRAARCLWRAQRTRLRGL